MKHNAKTITKEAFIDVHIRLDKQVYQQIKDAAIKEDRSVTAQMRHILADLFGTTNA